MSKYLDILKRYWGYEQFRPMQENIIRSVGSGRNDHRRLSPGGMIISVPRY